MSGRRANVARHAEFYEARRAQSLASRPRVKAELKHLRWLTRTQKLEPAEAKEAFEALRQNRELLARLTRSINGDASNLTRLERQEFDRRMQDAQTLMSAPTGFRLSAKACAE